MNKEERKEYNKDYYTKNKEIIIAKGCSKVICEFCERTVIKNNILKHQTLPICKRKADLKILNNLRKQENN
jgi:hypothetical protein